MLRTCPDSAGADALAQFLRVHSDLCANFRIVPVGARLRVHRQPYVALSDAYDRGRVEGARAPAEAAQRGRSAARQLRRSRRAAAAADEHSGQSQPLPLGIPERIAAIDAAKSVKARQLPMAH